MRMNRPCVFFETITQAHRPLVHLNAPVHMLPAQQAWPAPPHWAQLPLAHPSPEEHMSPAQQACPAAPHCPHTWLAVHDMDDAVHVSPEQHGWPAPPHWAQLPFAQPNPEEHVSPAQHVWPAPPHWPQT